MKLYTLSFLTLLVGISLFLKNGEENKMKLVWGDEFDYSGLPDSTKWDYDLGHGCPNCGWGNNELQYYTKGQMDNARVKDGYLTIEAKKNQQGKWKSARLITKGKQHFQYGKIQIRAKLPTGTGTWPALWLLSLSIEEQGWPHCGEIDIMEHVGKDQGRVHAALHTTSSSGDTHNKGNIMLEDCSTNFHVYELDWTEKALVFSVDGEKFYSYKPEEKNPENWPFDNHFYMIMNIAIGGNWASEDSLETEGLQNGVDPNIESASMVIDYVRVYQ